ncbi:hypothetical protein ASE00_18095 [Sphingomonas sp. Root710]|nr:hypothetical protein ASE00_18095 [Sphingomonas sp. Root710]
MIRIPRQNRVKAQAVEPAGRPLNGEIGDAANNDRKATERLALDRVALTKGRLLRSNERAGKP